MRFMMIVKASPESEEGQMPTAQEFADVGKYNDELIKAGVLLAAEGLTASREGARVQFHKDGRHSIKDGPFTESKELIAGFWLIQVKDKAEALAWAGRIPFTDGEVELRQVAEFGDLPEEVVSEEHRAKEKAWRDSNQKPIAQ